MIKCCKKFKCLSAGIYEDESGMMQYYADDCYAVCSTTFEMPFLHLFTNWNIFCILIRKQRLVDSLDLTMLCYYKVYYFRTLLAICFTLISLYLRDFRIPFNVTKTKFC